MTVFGRDTAITSLQTLLLGPELAVGALDVLAELQATTVDPDIDAEPGKIVHEVRHGRAAEFWFNRYYGSIDSTPLFLVLLAETFRWTDDTALVTRLKEPALRALEWIDRYGDRDGDGFVEYHRQTERGLANQSWKDSGDSQRFHDGRLAEPPIAPVEVQGYVYDAKLGLAEIARKAWRDAELADRLEQRGGRAAHSLQRGVLDTGARRLLRPRARRREAAGRLALLEHGPPALERDRPAGAGGRGRRPAPLGVALVGLGDPHDGERRGGLQPAELPQRDGVAARLRARSLGARPARARRSLAPRRAGVDRGRRPLRLVAARGVRRLRADGDAVPDRLPDRRPAAGLGGRHAHPPRPRAARPRARPRAPATRHDASRTSCRAGSTGCAWRASARSAAPGLSRSSVAVSRSRKDPDEGRTHLPSLVPRAAGGVRGHRARGRAPRGRPRRRRPRRHALRVRRLAQPGEDRLGLPDGAERVDRAHVLGAPARGERVPRVEGLRRHPRPHRPARARARGSGRRAVLPHGARPARRAAGDALPERPRADAEGAAHLDLAESARSRSRSSPGSRTARTRSISRCTRSGASPAATTCSSSAA